MPVEFFCFQKSSAGIKLFCRTGILPVRDNDRQDACPTFTL